MRNWLCRILITVTGLTLGVVGGAIYLAAWLDLGKTVDRQVDQVRDHVESRLWTFTETLAEDERGIQAWMHRTLPALAHLATEAHRDSGAVMPGKLEPGAWGLDDVRLIDGEAPDRDIPGLDADEVARLKVLAGSGLVLVDVMAVSPFTHRLEIAGYYSPEGSKVLIRGAVDVHDFGRRERTPAYRDYLFGTFFASDGRTKDFLQGIDVYLVNAKGGFSALREGEYLSGDVIANFEGEREVRMAEDDRVTILTRVNSQTSGLSGVRYAVIRTDFNLATVNEPWRQLGRLIVLVLLVTGFGAFLVFNRLFDRFLVRRVDAIVVALKAIAAGDYARPLVVAGDDELATIGQAVQAMRETIRERECELAEARASLERRVAERTQELAKEIEVRKRYERHLRDIATHDPLTGLANRRAFDERTAEEIGRANRYGRPLALVMVDVDHFKRINDTYGHPVGDEVLQTISAVLGSHRRANDLAARVGGEEFALLLPETEAEEARVVAERLRAAVEQQHILTRAGVVQVTISAGVSAWTGDIRTSSAFLASVDAALYQAKNGGRNQVCIAA